MGQTYCDAHVLARLARRLVLGVGKFAEGRCKNALADIDVEIGTILHPSPASPRANRGWAEQAENDLERYGIKLS